MTALASAHAGFWWGLLELHPYAKVSETYDSNIYLVPEDKASGARVGGGVVGSWITQGLFGARLMLPISGMHKLDAGYEGEGLLYSKQPSANNAFNHKANFGYNYAGPMGITGRLQLSGLVEACRRPHRREGLIRTSDEDARLARGGVAMRIMPAWRWFLTPP